MNHAETGNMAKPCCPVHAQLYSPTAFGWALKWGLRNMRGSLRATAVVALLSMGLWAGNSSMAYAAEDAEADTSDTSAADGDDGDDGDAEVTPVQNDDDGSPIGADREVVAPQPYEGAPVEEDKDVPDDEDRDADVQGFDFDSTASDLLDSAGDE